MNEDLMFIVAIYSTILACLLFVFAIYDPGMFYYELDNGVICKEGKIYDGGIIFSNCIDEMRYINPTSYKRIKYAIDDGVVIRVNE